jgi:Fe-coproporphyrin III synthase
MEICDSKERVGLKADPFRTIQIHPTRRCNLTCLHCYSSSAPHFRDMLNIEALKRFLSYAYEHGFNNISVSGGEPFLYNELEELLMFSRSLGYQNTLASNGMLLQSAKNQRILEYVDLIALSIDGSSELHDHIRGQKGAYDKMMQGVEVLNALQKPFGFIHTVTPQSWDSLIWLGEFAYENGAKLLQLHPLEMYGRALEELSNLSIDDTLAHQIFILANYLQSKYADKMVVQVDLLHRDYLETYPEIVNTFERECASNPRISNLLDNITLPIAYGFEATYAIGNINDFQESLFDNFMTEKIPMLKALFSQTLEKVFLNSQIDIVNWNELLVNESKVKYIA